MIRLFYGENRLAANQEIKKILGNDYEVIDGPELEPNDLPNIFLGRSLFQDQRNILIRDIFTNSAVAEKLPDYLDSPHNIVMLELKIDTRLNSYKAIKDHLEVKKFALTKNPDLGQVFNIYSTAKKNGPEAIIMLEKIKHLEDPIMFAGLLFFQAIKDYARHQGAKEKKALKELSKLDIDLKSSKLSPWTLIESFLLRLSSL